MTNPETYAVFAIRYAERNARTRKGSFIFDPHHDAPHPMDYFVWVVRNQNRTVLVDTGYDGTEATDRGRSILVEPAEALTAMGIAPESLEAIVVTHLHYDHAGGLTRFPGVRLHLQAKEMAFATGPSLSYETLRAPFTAGHVCEAVQRLYAGPVSFLDGDAEIAPGISVHRIGGHSKGLQCVRVETAHGPLVLASDAAHYYENFERYKPFPIVADVGEMLAGFDRLRVLAGPGAHIIPGHDPLVTQHYPIAFPGLDFDVRRPDVPPSTIAGGRRK